MKIFNGLILLIAILLVLFLILCAAVISFLGAIGIFIGLGAPYVPTHDKTMKKMVMLLNIKLGEKAVDLGSGDGKIVIALAQAGAEAHGYEINPFLVLWSKRNIKKAGFAGKAFIHWKSFWGADFSSFQVVTIYGITYVMKRLEKKLQKELKHGSRVASNAFTFPHWSPLQSDNGVHLYKK